MDRNGKKPKAKQDQPAHPERSDTKGQHRDDESTDANARAAAKQTETDERIALVSKSQKGPQRL